MASGKGELVFARSQNFAGWLRLAGEEGWMLAFAPEHGQLLQAKEAKAKSLGEPLPLKCPLTCDHVCATSRQIL